MICFLKMSNKLTLSCIRQRRISIAVQGEYWTIAANLLVRRRKPVLMVNLSSTSYKAF